MTNRWQDLLQPPLHRSVGSFGSLQGAGIQRLAQPLFWSLKKPFDFFLGELLSEFLLRCVFPCLASEYTQLCIPSTCGGLYFSRWKTRGRCVRLQGLRSVGEGRRAHDNWGSISHLPEGWGSESEKSFLHLMHTMDWVCWLRFAVQTHCAILKAIKWKIKPFSSSSTLGNFPVENITVSYIQPYVWPYFFLRWDRSWFLWGGVGGWLIMGSGILYWNQIVSNILKWTHMTYIFSCKIIWKSF